MWSTVGGGAGADNVTWTLAFDNKAKILYVAGAFSNIGGINSPYLAAWNGSSWFGLGSGVDSEVNAITVDQSSGTVYVGGFMSTAGGLFVGRIAGWNGTVWFTLGSGTSGYVNTLAYDSRSKMLYAGGVFSDIGGIAARNLAAWNGSEWFAVGGGADQEVTSITFVDIWSVLFVGGRFSSVGANVTVLHLAAWNSLESAWLTLPAPFSGTYANVVAFEFENTSKILYLGGSFYHGAAVNNVQGWNGNAFLSMDTGVDGNGFVSSLALDSVSGLLFVGGQFAYAGQSSLSVSNITAWNGTAWLALQGGGPDGLVEAVAVDSSSGILYVGGQFRSADGIHSSNIIQYRFAPVSATSDAVTSTALSSSSSQVCQCCLVLFEWCLCLFFVI